MRTDLFTLGSALQVLITGEEVFLDLVRSTETHDDIMRWFRETEPEVERRFRAGEFPSCRRARIRGCHGAPLASDLHNRRPGGCRP